MRFYDSEVTRLCDVFLDLLANPGRCAQVLVQKALNDT
jgi:hypothetical protein